MAKPSPKTVSLAQIRAAYPDWQYTGGSARRFINPLTGQTLSRRGMLDRYIAEHPEQYGEAKKYEQLSPTTKISKRHIRTKNGKRQTIPGHVRTYQNPQSMRRYMQKHPGQYMIVVNGVPLLGYVSQGIGTGADLEIFRVVLPPSYITPQTLPKEWQRFQDRLPEIFDTEQPLTYHLEQIPERS